MTIIFIILKLIIFWIILFFFGYQAWKYIFRNNQNNIWANLSLFGSIGLAVYIFFVNSIGHFTPIGMTFYLILFILAGFGVVLYFLNKQKNSLEFCLNKENNRWVFLVVFMIMILSGLIVFRTMDVDNFGYPHLPTATSIVGGNFPIKHLNIPEQKLIIHYGANLLYAAISKMTGLSILSSFRFSVFLFSGIVFLLIFNIAKLFIKKNNLGVLFVSLIVFLGGGFRFIYGFEGLITLYKKFILHYNIEHPFAFLGEVWSVSPLFGPLGIHIFNSWFALGWVLVLASIYLYLKTINDKKRSYFCDLLMIVLLSVLALTFEMGFMVVYFGMFATPFIFYFKDRNREDFKAMLKHSLLVLTIVAIIVLFQGGTITTMFENIVQHKSSYGVGLGFSFFQSPLSFDPGNGLSFSFYDLTFILNFGLIYFLIIPAIIFMVKKNFREGIFLSILSCFSFLIPLFLSFDYPWQGTMDRFFRFAGSVGAILVGVFLVANLLQFKNNRFLKILISICLIIICLDGVLFLSTRPLYKKVEHRLNNNNFFSVLRPLSEVEAVAYKWIKNNSIIEDYFLFFADKSDINDEPSILETFRFVMFAQRLAPVYTQSQNHIAAETLPPDEYYTPIYKRLISDCNREDMKILNYRYLFVDNNWPIGLEEKCLANNDLEVKFKAEEGDRFVRIYEVK